MKNLKVSFGAFCSRLRLVNSWLFATILIAVIKNLEDLKCDQLRGAASKAPQTWLFFFSPIWFGWALKLKDEVSCWRVKKNADEWWQEHTLHEFARHRKKKKSSKKWWTQTMMNTHELSCWFIVQSMRLEMAVVCRVSWSGLILICFRHKSILPIFSWFYWCVVTFA